VKENILEKKSRTEILAVFGNLLQLRRLHPLEQENINLLKVLMSLLSLLKQDDKTQSYAAIWHLMFGWTHKMIDRRLLDCLPHLRLQLNQLWDVSLIKELYSPLLALQWTPPHLQKKKGSSIRNIFVQPPRVMTDEEMKMVYISSHFYSDCLLQLPQMSMDILIGLSASGDLPSKLWLFISQVLRLDVKSFVHHYKTKSQLVHVVSLMCQSICCLLSILDDIELYEAQKHIPMEELIKLTTFLNSLLYSCIWEESVLVTDDQVIQSSMMLLTLLLQRNQRRNFILEDILLMKNFKSGRFLSEWKAFTPRALSLLQHIPHVIPHPKRVEIFYEYIKADKAELGIGSGRSHVSASYITIHRNRLLEDGYEQLSSLSTANAKGVIRVKFINEQGLDEAGIDELGVFKEFLEEIIKQAFDSSLGLFKRNSDGCLYPSPTSECHSNHLAIFEFVGKILAKAVYEGIVIDLPFAMFFLHQMIKQFHNSLYSSLDELHSLDPELSKSLHFIKHYDGDMEDLCLTFSFEEEFLGKMVTHELIPGGSGISVTADNRISYVHRLAHYKLTTQIKHQMEAFMKGFHSIVNPKWITIFSPQEFQRVISGDGSDYNIDDLRKTTQYYGGYHDKHRVIGWLWDILKNDFNSNERAAFLKVNTSCVYCDCDGLCFVLVCH
jgi:ubiquitin-protein ligase E3 B